MSRKRKKSIINLSILKENSKLRMRIISLFSFACVFVLCITAFPKTFSDLILEFDGDSDYRSSGVSGSKIYVNDLESDYNYYMGLNYTSNDGTLPSIDNKNLYNNNTLAQVKITYNGNGGYVSKSENQSTMIYFKTIPINNNGTSDNNSDDYIVIDLIDNPFTDRPNDKAFNGWYTAYQNVNLSFDNNYYERKAKVPVTYSNGKPNKIDIIFGAKWIDANIQFVGDNFDNAISNFNEEGMKALNASTIVYGDLNMAGYYHSTSIGFGRSYAGYYNNSGVLQNRGTCYTIGGCTYYSKITNEIFSSSSTYYQLVNGSMTIVDNSTLQRPVNQVIIEDGYEGINMTTYYRTKHVLNGSSIDGLYDNNGNSLSGTCGTGAGCNYYELINYYDDDGNEEMFDPYEEYYYLVTRETNILVINNSISSTWSDNGDYPFTVTSLHNDNLYNVTWNVSNSAVNCYNDTVIENVKVYYGTTINNIYNPPTNTTTNGVLYGRFNNVKVGRGLIKNGNYPSFRSVLGGSNGGTGNSNNPTKYKLTIESGFYNSFSLSNGNALILGSTIYVNGKGVYGNDIDRILNNNSNLTLYYCAASSWGGSVYSGNSTSSTLAFDLTVKSGSFGTSKYDYTTGIYAGGRSGIGDLYGPKSVKVEGGYIYNLIGSPLTASSRSTYNDVYLSMTGGEVDVIFGGAGSTATNGNRIISVTGGIVNYSVFGGSNGHEDNTGNGTVNGTPYIYIGGNATIGKTDYVNNNYLMYGAEAGSVFGIGNGRNNSSSVGSCDNSIIIIDGDAIIKKNVYGGGNLGATGVSSSLPSTYSNIIMHDGYVYGSIYGGGNKNGSGSDSKTSTVNITVDGGNVIGSVYGGSNELGTIYGSVNINIIGGEISNSVYGGGRGGYANNNNSGTYVRDNVNVVIGDADVNIAPVINTSVYGGSAYGTVNGVSRTTDISNYNTNVTVNKGIVGSVFGGGQGDNNYTPYVEGNVLVTINGGNIDYVYGGNDQSGTPNGNVIVYVNGGTIGETYGGGNKTAVPITNVYLTGGTSNKIFGGSNVSGDVITSNVTTSGGTCTNLYGGNNQGGTTGTTNVTINGGNITNAYGGGEKTSVITNTNVIVNGDVTNVFGGSNTSGNIPDSYVTINSGNVGNVYGGNDQGGITSTSHVVINDGNVDSAYGGGLKATTPTTNIIASGGNITNLYGGGHEAGATVTNVVLDNATLGNVYGGSNTSGDVPNSYITSTGNYVAGSIYGGNNQGGITTNPHINLTSGTSTNIFGGGNNAASGITSTELDNVNARYVYGGGNNAAVAKVELTIKNSIIGTNTNSGAIYGGGNNGVVNGNVVATIDDSTINGDVYGGGNAAKVSGIITLNITDVDITGNVYGGGNLGEIDSTINTTINSGTVEGNIYGGGNAAAVNTSVNLNVHGTNVTGSVYGGGNGENSIVSGDETGERNHAKINGNTTTIIDDNAVITGSVYGGGNLGMVTGNTNVTASDVTIHNSIYGGGNAAIVGGDTHLYANGINVSGSVYAGGNGTTAIVRGNSNVDVDNGTVVGNHIFGGGNAAATGTSDNNNSKGIVNIVGATVNGNVYGGANTSVIYGETIVNIGSSAVNNDNLIPTNIYILGTVFGGGEANASGSANYDYSFISVTSGITMNIDATGYDQFLIDGSIFGSGNASSTSGVSNVYIKNYGDSSNVKKNISIQRANEVTLDSCYIMLSGATDRTNEYSSVLFSLSRIDKLKVKNGTNIYLRNGTNLVKKFYSLVDVNGSETKASVNIDTENSTFNRNVNNRLYAYEGININIATNESVTSYGEVYGMTFFGLYNLDRNGNIITSLYNDYGMADSSVSSGDINYFTNGSYVLGKHYTNHNIEVDGFYTNYGNESGTGVHADYIVPTPDDDLYYMWSIGEMVDSYNLTLTASKYSTLGIDELLLRNHTNANTTFSIIGVSFNDLESDVSLVDYNEIPRVASSTSEANTKFGLNMKSGQSGWITDGSTNFITGDGSNITGTVDYERENSSGVSGLVFYLYHSKNVTRSGSLGSVTIAMNVITPIDDLNNEVVRVNINIELVSALYNTNDYEGTITPGKQYEMFASSDVNITNKSSFSAYYSLFMQKDTTPYGNGYHRSLVSSYLFPVNTEITMIDFHSEEEPVYYYYVVNENDYADFSEEYARYNEVSYDFSKFIKMGSTSSTNNYNDALANSIYYSNNMAVEEFIFMVDFKDTNITQAVEDQSLLIELRNNDNQTLISVISVERDEMKYSLYNDSDSVIELDGSLNNKNIYLGKSATLTLDTSFIQGNSSVIDTNYYDNKLGIKMSIIDSNGHILNSSSLMGVSYEYNGDTYYPRYDGTIRIKLSDKIANTRSKIIVNTGNSKLATGEYTLHIESFGSSDGIYYGLQPSDELDLEFNIIDTIYGLSIDVDDDVMFIDKNTGFIKDNNVYKFKLGYASDLDNPNTRIKLMRRDYSAIYTNVYNDVNILDYVTNEFNSVSPGSLDYYLSDSPSDNSTYFLYFKDNLKSGTYKLCISLYDGNVYIGDVYRYIIIK